MSSSFPEKPILEVETLLVDDERSVARVVINGLNSRIVNHRSTTTYSVCYGGGYMEIDGVMHVLEDGVELTVPAGTPYRDAGHQLVMIATSVPPFNRADVEILAE